jgi:zona occludens toxin (predicted ATPase)
MENLQTMGPVEDTSSGKNIFKNPKIIAVFAIALVALGGLLYVFREKKQRDMAQDALRQRLQALEQLDKNSVPLTEAETKLRVTALESLAKEQKPLTPEQTQNRLQALEVLQNEQVTQR